MAFVGLRRMKLKMLISKRESLEVNSSLLKISQESSYVLARRRSVLGT
jgi:hypothetical protein